MTTQNPRQGFVQDGITAAIKAVDAATDAAVAVLNGGVDLGQDAITKINELKKQLLDELNKAQKSV